MFIRFESPVRDGYSRANLGIFQTIGRCLSDTPRDQRGWQHAELRREVNWFNDQMDVPHRLYYRGGRRAGRSGICWFRDHATEHIERARYMAWLLDDLGTPILMRLSDTPGSILWQDPHQVVALPPSTSIREGHYIH